MVGVDSHARAIESKLGVDPGESWPTIGIIKGDALPFDRHLKLACLAVGERKIGEVANQLDPRIVTGAGNQQRTQPVANRRRACKRNVAVRLPGVEAGELRRDVNRAGPFSRGSVLAAGVAGDIRVVEDKLVYRDRRPLMLPPPTKLPLHMIERQRFCEDTRQLQGQRTTLHLEGAAKMCPLEASREAAYSRMTILRREPHVDEPRSRIERFWRDGLTDPFQFALLHGAARRQSRERVTQMRRQWQCRSDTSQRTELQTIELELPVVHRLGSATQRDLEIGRIQAKAIAPGERKLADEKLALLAVDAPTHASLQAIERELRQIVAESRLDIGQNEIRHQLARLAARELKPEPHRAGSALDGNRKRQP